MPAKTHGKALLNDTNASRAALEVTDLHKRFGSIEVLKGVSLTARTGNVISIIGSSGSGKSTFLRCVNLLESPNGGSIALDGETLALKETPQGLVTADAKQLQRLRAQIGFVFQT